MAAPYLEAARYRACASRRACVRSRSLFCCDLCNLIVKLTGLLLVIRFHHCVNYGSCGFRAPASVLNERGDDMRPFLVTVVSGGKWIPYDEYKKGRR